MDERTRRADDDLAPTVRPTAPGSDVKTPSRWKFRIGIGLIAILLIIGLYLGSMSPGTAPSDFASMIVFP